MNYMVNDKEIPEDLPEKRGRPVGSYRVKMNKSQKQSFMNESIKMILNNHFSYTEYVEWCKNTKHVSKQQANAYWNQVWRQINKKFEYDKDKLILKHLAHYWDVYAQAKDNGDLSTARQTLNDLAKIQDLNPVEKVEVSHQVIRVDFGTTELPERDQSQII